MCLPFGMRYSAASLTLGGDNNAALALVVLAEADKPVDLGNDRNILRLASLKESAYGADHR